MKLPKSKVPDGYNWTIEYTNDVKSFDPKLLKLHLEPEQKDGYIKGKVLVDRMKSKGLSANVLDYLLDNHRMIPSEWKGKWVYFWGTVYRGSVGYLCVRCLFWSGDGWSWDCGWLDGGWGSRNPALLLASTEVSEANTSLDILPSELVINGITYIKK